MMELLKKLAESNTINFIIMLGILAVIVIKMNLKASMDTSISNVAGIIKKSDEAKSIEEKKISNDLQKKTIEESILMAEKNIKRMLSENSDLHRQFIQESLDELDKVNL